jgi:hypothetical protein
MFSDLQIHPNDTIYTDDYRAYVWQKFCIARKYQPKTIIEIGVRAGYSAYAFLTAAPESYYFGFDAENGSHGGEGGPYLPWAKKQLSKFPNVTLSHLDTQTVDTLGDIKADFIHVDGDHTSNGVLHDLEMVLKNHLTPDGVIVVDDIDRIDEVKNGVAYFLRHNPNLKYKYMETFNGEVLIGNIHQLNTQKIKTYSLMRRIKEASGKADMSIKDEVDVFFAEHSSSSIIYDYKDKKISDYCKDDAKILILWIHGLGDTIMFYPLYEELKKKYPNTIIDIYTESGQQEIFPSVDIRSKTMQDYDHVFYVHFAMVENYYDNYTKIEYCCEQEMGIPFPDNYSFANLPDIKNPIVLVHFQGTCLPESVNCPPEVAEKIWEEIKNSGKIPMECHFLHAYANPENNKYSFIDNSVRPYKASLPNLIGLIQNSFAFIGVASGPFCVATSCIPERTLFLENRHKVECYDSTIQSISVKDFKDGDVENWLSSLQERR